MTALICVLPVGMVYLQPNLSTTIVICFMILCMVYVAGISYKWIAGAVAVGVPGFAALIYLSLQGFIPFLQKYQAQDVYKRQVSESCISLIRNICSIKK